MYGFGGPLGIIEVIVGWGLQSTSLVLAGRFVKEYKQENPGP